jgi:hypothetical protein
MREILMREYGNCERTELPSQRIVNSLPSGTLLPSEGLLGAREMFKKFVIPP